MENNLVNLFEIHLKKIKNRELVTKLGGTYKEGTISGYTTAYNWLYNYAQSHNNCDMENINDAWLHDFIQFLTGHQLALNSIGCIVNRLADFYRHPVNIAYPFPFLVKYKLSEHFIPFYNSVDELDKIYHLSCVGMKALVRDIYLFCCNVGLRFSDTRKILSIGIWVFMSELRGKNCIQLTTGKTDKPVIIPLNTIAMEIVRRNGYFKDKKIPCIQTFNKWLKIIGRDAGLTKYVTRQRTVGGTLREFVLRRYELITSHTARRSFATNCYLSGVPTRQIMMVTGHSEEITFRLYIGADNLDNVKSLIEYPFFQ